MLTSFVILENQMLPDKTFKLKSTNLSEEKRDIHVGLIFTSARIP